MHTVLGDERAYSLLSALSSDHHHDINDNDEIVFITKSEIMAPPPTTEQSFRANLSQFRWAQGNNDDSQQQQTQAPNGNPFSRFYNAIGSSYVPLRSNERSNEEEAYFALSRWDRHVVLESLSKVLSLTLFASTGC